MLGYHASMLAPLSRFADPRCRLRAVWLLAVGVAVLLCSPSCGFPGYRFPSAGSGGELAGAAGTNAGSGGGGTAGMMSNVSGASGSDAAGESGTGGGDDGCHVAVPPMLPEACSNGTKDGLETATDCGGGTCSPCVHADACAQDDDCKSEECKVGLCTPFVKLETQAIVRPRNTFTVQFRFRITYLGSKPLDMKNLVLRYYFARGNAAEPIVPNATQAVLNSATSVAPDTHWQVVRVLSAPSELTNAYLEVTFTGSRSLITTDFIELTQSVQTANVDARQFDQLTHYSFVDDDAYVLNEHATVYSGGALVWGTPPPYVTAPGCAYSAVNFAGDALTLSAPERHFIAGSDPSLEFTGETLHVTSMPFPTNAALLPLLQSAVVLDTAHVSWQVPNGQYWLYPYVISAGGTNLADLLVQGEVVDSFLASAINNQPVWSRLGPYAVSVDDGKLDIGSAGGALRLAGAELFQAAH